MARDPAAFPKNNRDLLRWLYRCITCPTRLAISVQMPPMTTDPFHDQLENLKARVELLENEMAAQVPLTFEPKNYRLGYYVTAGFLLGLFGACTSLLANVIGSVYLSAVTGEPQHPLRLIQIYLTFPMGEQALTANTGLLLAMGCMLYLGTSMLYGMFFQVTVSRFFPNSTLPARLVICGVLALTIWIVNYYFIFSWLQPLMFGGNWIVAMVPPWVAAATHLVFGWTMAVVYPLGEFRTYQTDVRKPI
jgi:hypothetical protein